MRDPFHERITEKYKMNRKPYLRDGHQVYTYANDREDFNNHTLEFARFVASRMGNACDMWLASVSPFFSGPRILYEFEWRFASSSDAIMIKISWTGATVRDPYA